MSNVWSRVTWLADQVMSRLEERERLKDQKLNSLLSSHAHPLPVGARRYWEGFDWSKGVKPLLPRKFHMGEFEADVPEVSRPRFSWKDAGGGIHVTLLHFDPVNSEKATLWKLLQLVYQSPSGSPEILRENVSEKPARQTFSRSRLLGIVASLQKASFDG